MKAEPLFRRALEIEEAKLGPDVAKVAGTLHHLGMCVHCTGRRGQAEPLFRRALEIKEAKLGSDDDLDVTGTLVELGRCVQAVRRRRRKS